MTSPNPHTLYRLFILQVITVMTLLPMNMVAQQTTFSYNTVPLNKEVNIRLLGADKQYLQCYNLYGFVYVTDTDSVAGEFIVWKDADTFQHKDDVVVKLCKVKEFAILVGNKCTTIQVESGIQLKYPGQKDLLYLNFDPEIPDAIFIPCK